jgi:hypothetical protein
MLGGMRVMQRLNPGPGLADFWEQFRKPQPYRWPILAVSAAPIALVLYWATEETVYVPPRPPEVTYITTFAEGRTDAEIIASNEANQARNNKIRAQIEELEERKREMYRELGRATGIDVDAMEAQIEADRAREEARKAALRNSAPSSETNSGSTEVESE